MNREPVLGRATIAAVVQLLVMGGVISQTDAPIWVDTLVVILPPLITLIGAGLGRQKVKPDTSAPKNLPTALLDRAYIAAVLQAVVLLGLVTQAEADAWLEGLTPILPPLLTMLGAILAGRVTDSV